MVAISLLQIQHRFRNLRLTGLNRRLTLGWLAVGDRAGQQIVAIAGRDYTGVA
jgi:hypothetical protein